MVSSRLSPLAVEERAMSRLKTSADRRLAAISKVVRVRVLFSKNRLNTLLPRRSGTFLTSRSLTLTNWEAVSRMCVRMSRDRPSVDSRWMSSPCLLSWGFLERNMAVAGGGNAPERKAGPGNQDLLGLRRKLKLPSSARASASDCPAGSSSRAAAYSASMGS